MISILGNQKFLTSVQILPKPSRTRPVDNSIVRIPGFVGTVDAVDGKPIGISITAGLLPFDDICPEPGMLAGFPIECGCWVVSELLLLLCCWLEWKTFVDGLLETFTWTDSVVRTAACCCCCWVDRSRGGATGEVVFWEKVNREYIT